MDTFGLISEKFIGAHRSPASWCAIANFWTGVARTYISTHMRKMYSVRSSHSSHECDDSAEHVTAMAATRSLGGHDDVPHSSQEEWRGESFVIRRFKRITTKITKTCFA